MAESKDNPMEKHRAQFKAKASELGKDVQDLGKITKNIADETAQHLRENAGDYYKQGKEKAQKLEESLEVKIKENPIKALLIALGVGWLLGILTRRR